MACRLIAEVIGEEIGDKEIIEGLKEEEARVVALSKEEAIIDTFGP